MNQDYIVPDNWSVIEEGFEAGRVEASESLFSIGNGAMGQRANFEENYSGKTFQGSYIGGIYYPDKTKVGWWKNGYPEYFAKVLNAPNWIGINVEINGESLDLNTCSEVRKFRRELNMKEGWYNRSFEAVLQNGTQVAVNATRFLSMDADELGVINYQVTPLNGLAKIVFRPYVDGGVKNEDANWEESFWEPLDVKHSGNEGFVVARTFKTHFNVAAFMHNSILLNGNDKNMLPEKVEASDNKIQFTYTVEAGQGETAAIVKFGGYTVSLNHANDTLVDAAKNVIAEAKAKGYEALLNEQTQSWAAIWEMADITIDGDVRAQQGIRFNIFQLNQTYSGKDQRLNIGPKGFTGEKYGGSTYWDTEAYCIPFYMATKDQQVARNLLTYRYNQLDKAIENAGKLGFNNGAALYPMVTMNGEECHNEWEITFEEIHRNGAIAYAIHDYVRYTDDRAYLAEYGFEVLLGIARFWSQRITWSEERQKFVMLGVTGPNEYENNVNNNWYTNYIACWCLRYVLEVANELKSTNAERYQSLIGQLHLSEETEFVRFQQIIDQMHYPASDELGIFLQQDNYLDKENILVSDLRPEDRPLNQKWSWDRILRSPFIKQADVLQGLYFFEEEFSADIIRRNYDYYEPRTVHESSLSPCVHGILASGLNMPEKAYEMYLRTSRLDLDDYNNDTEDGLHITSMAGTWMSIVKGFGGLRIKDGQLHLSPTCPQQWQGYSFTIRFRNNLLGIKVNTEGVTIENREGETLNVWVNGEDRIIEAAITPIAEEEKPSEEAEV